MAFRTPISWVRSVTVAIIILVILIEPTIIEIIAIIESKTVISLILEEAGCEICSSDASWKAPARLGFSESFLFRESLMESMVA